MRKLFIRVAILLSIVAAPLAASATGANAAIINPCYNEGVQYVCTVQEDMGSGSCSAWTEDLNNFAVSQFTDDSTGYTCEFWVERNVNGTGWYRISPLYDLPSGTPTIEQPPNYWDGSGYLARVCFKFIWSSSSSGDTHCSIGV